MILQSNIALAFNEVVQKQGRAARSKDLRARPKSLRAPDEEIS